MTPSARAAWWLAPLTALGLLVPLLISPPAQAAERGTMPTSCVDPTECLYFTPLFHSNDPGEPPSNEAWDILPVNTAPGTREDDLWRGTFQIRQHSTKGEDQPQCMASNQDQQVETCEPTIRDQLWYIEPVGIAPIVTDPGSASVWNPFDHPFYLRSADNDHDAWCYGSKFNDLHADQNDGDTYAEFHPCHEIDADDLSVYQWRLGRTSPYGHPVVPDSPYTEATKSKVSNYLLGAALAHALSACQAALEASRDICAAKLIDTNQGGPEGTVVSQWSRMKNLQVTEPPAPVLLNNSCAAGQTGTTEDDTTPSPGTARVLYNGGDSDMNATLGASGTNGYSSSLTTGLSVTVTQSWGALFAKGSVAVTASVEYGKTWSQSFTTSQDVNWRIPPHKYATATMSTSALQLLAKWKFNDGLFNEWLTDGFTRLTVPFSADSTAGEPDSVLAVYNTWDKKACAASAPSHLDQARILQVQNLTTPEAAPKVGDVLGANINPENAADWFVLPAFSDAPVALRYQWYRQRSGEPAEAISNARSATYTVTGDDVTDPEVLDRFGPYHLYVGVTDVSNQMRFDSAEYRSLATAAVTDVPGQVGETNLTMSILNADIDAGTDTIVDISASAAGAVAPPTGTVVIRDNDVAIGDPIPLGPDGEVRTRLRLPRGAHALEAVYSGDGTVSGARSNVVHTTVVGTASRTTLELDDPSTKVGQVTRATVKVEPVGDADVDPGGQVRLRADGDTLGGPVTLQADGTAEVTLPAATGSGPRDITASYLGDPVFEPSVSEAVTQQVAAIGTEITLQTDTRVTWVRGTVRLLASVVSPTAGRPQGTAQFLVDGRAQGSPVALDSAGKARLKVRGLPKGSHRITAKYHPASSVHRGAVSGTTMVKVRKYGVRTKVKTDRKIVRKKQKMVVRGTVRIIKKGPSVAGRKVQLVVDGVVIETARVSRRGTYRMVVKGRQFAKGDNRVRVRYVGSRARSIAPDMSRGVSVHR